MLFTRATVKIQKHEKVASKRMEKIHNANNDQKQAEVTMLISDKTNIKRSTKQREKGHFIKMKECIHQENVIIINVHVPNTSASKYIKQNLVKRQGEWTNPQS